MSKDQKHHHATSLKVHLTLTNIFLINMQYLMTKSPIYKLNFCKKIITKTLTNYDLIQIFKLMSKFITVLK